MKSFDSCNWCLVFPFFAQNIYVTAIDISEHATKLTLENADLFGLNDSNRLIVHHCGVKDFPDFLKSNSTHENFKPPFDIVVSNPPYVKSPEMCVCRIKFQLFVFWLSTETIWIVKFEILKI